MYTNINKIMPPKQNNASIESTMRHYKQNLRNRKYIQLNLYKADTIGTTRKCPLYESVCFIESRPKSVS